MDKKRYLEPQVEVTQMETTEVIASSMDPSGLPQVG